MAERKYIRLHNIAGLKNGDIISLIERPKESTTRFRIRVADHYAYRDEHGTLVETGWLGPEGEEHCDRTVAGPHVGQPRIDGTNPAAMVPINQEWV